MWPGPPSGVPARTMIPRSAERGDDRRPRRGRRASIQEKLACESGVASPSSRTPSSTVHPLDDRSLDPLGDVVGVADRLRAGGLGDGVDAERLAHRVDRGAEPGEQSA